MNKLLGSAVGLLLSVFFLLACEQLAGQCGSCQYAVNLVANGDFSAGNNGFTTAYSLGSGFFCPLCPENTYAVGSNAFFYHSDFVGLDHTNPPTGKFLIVNGSANAGAHVWCQQFTVQPGTDYQMIFWAQDITNNSNPHPHAQLQVLINGVAVSAMEEIEAGWEQVSLNWNSGTNTSAEVCIINLQDQTGGNDFGIDDISFTGCHHYQLTQMANAGADVTVCNGQTVSVGAPAFAGYTYQWSGSSSLSSTTSANPQYAAVNNSINPVTEELILSMDSAGVGCISTDTVLVTVWPMPPFTLGADVVLCPGDTAWLNAGSGWDNILWSTGSTEQWLAVSAQGVVSCTVASGQCTASDDAVISVIALPAIDLGPDTHICEGETAVLVSGYAGSWSNGQFGVSTAVNAQGTYYFTYTTQGCNTTDSIAVWVDVPPQPLLLSDTLLCEGSSITLHAGMPVQWSTGFFGESVTVNSPGLVGYVAVNGACQVLSGALIESVALPEVDLPVNVSACQGSDILLVAHAPQNDWYLWSDGSTNDTLRVYDAGVYAVEVGNQCGTALDSTLVFFDVCGWDLFIPNAFTPNGDERNEGWFVQGFNIAAVQVTVFNRLGVPVWKAGELGESWFPDERLVGDDVYNYLVTGSNVFGEKFRKTGHIYLLK